MYTLYDNLIRDKDIVLDCPIVVLGSSDFIVFIGKEIKTFGIRKWVRL